MTQQRGNTDVITIFKRWLSWLETEEGVVYRKANGGNGDDLDRIAIIPTPPGSAIFTVGDLRETLRLMSR